jgi:alkylation response protein AidB-like acyl-CoA dehydrogenase
VIIEPNEEQRLLLETTRRFLANKVPLTVVRELAGTDLGFARDWWKQVGHLGWTSFLVDETHGGIAAEGFDLVGLVLITAEVGRLVAPGPLVPVNLVAAALSNGGTERQRKEHLPGLMAGEQTAGWCVAEPGAPYGAAGVRLQATRTETGLVLNGVKSPVEAAPFADVFLVTARLDDALAQILVPADAAGITINPLDSLDVVRRFGEVIFSDVTVPLDAEVPHASVADELERQLEIAAILHCAEMVGAADRVFEFSLEYLFDRFSFGRALASYQALKHRAADSKMWIEACKGTTEAAARACEARQESAPMLASVAKSLVGDLVPEIVQDCVQLNGGIAVTWEHDIHLYLRRVTVDRNIYGTPSDHRERIASYLLELRSPAKGSDQ